jgi:predicted protein tyrosine phosphatase
MEALLPLVQIARGLFLGNEIHSASRSLLVDYNIHFIVNAAANQVSNHFSDFNYQYLPLDLFDTTSDDIHQYFNSTFEFIEKSQLDGRSCLVHCKSGKSRSAVIVMAYLMRKYRAPLKEVFRLLLLLTRGSIKPNSEFLAQLIDYEVEILGTSSMGDQETTVAEEAPILTASSLGLPMSFPEELDDEEAQETLYKRLKSLILVNKWPEISKLNEEYRDENFEPWPIFQRLLRRAIYSGVSLQMNFVVEKVPTPIHPTTMLIHTYIEQTRKAISDLLPTSLESGYLETFDHAVSFTLGVSNVGVGSIFIDHLTQKMSAVYRAVHSGKLPSHSQNTAEKTGQKESAIEALLRDTRQHAKIVFGLFSYLCADSNLVSYLEEYELGLSQRLSLFLPLEGTPTHELLGLEDEIAQLVPHPAHGDKIKRMISDINRVSELNSNFEASIAAENSLSSPKGPKLEVVVLDSKSWPSSTFTKYYDGSSVPMTIIPIDLYPTWSSFKNFVQKSEENSSSQLLLLPHLGDAQIVTHFGSKQYTLDVTTSMMLVLCCFNDNVSSLSYSALQSQLNMTPKLLTQTLFSLSHPGCQILLRYPTSNGAIAITDSFSRNNDFTHKLRRIKVPNVKYPHSDASITKAAIGTQ